MAKDYSDRRICPLFGKMIDYSRCCEIQNSRDDTMNYVGLEVDFDEESEFCRNCGWFEIENR